MHPRRRRLAPSRRMDPPLPLPPPGEQRRRFRVLLSKSISAAVVARDTTLCGVVVTLILHAYPTTATYFTPNARCYTTPSRTPNPLNVKRIRTPPSPRERNILLLVCSRFRTTLYNSLQGVFVLFFVSLDKKKKNFYLCKNQKNQKSSL